MPYSTVSLLVSTKSSSAYFTVRIISPPSFKTLNPSKASLVIYSLYKLNKIGNKEHPYRTPLPNFTFSLVHRTLPLLSTYDLVTKVFVLVDTSVLQNLL
jgi:hypothetical protein